MQLALMLIWTSWVLLGVGIVLLVSGLLMSLRPSGRRGVDNPESNFGQALIGLIKKSHVIIFSPTAKPWRRFAAAGMLLIFLGIAFLIAGVIPQLIAQLASQGGDANPDPSPPVTDGATSSPTSP